MQILEFMPTDWLLEEYKIIQAKIDNVTEHQFKVRSWSVTLLAGFVLGTFATNRSPYTLLLSIPIILVFHLQDHRQKNLRIKLGERAFSIERGLRMLPRSTIDSTREERDRWRIVTRRLRDMRQVPGIARILGAREDQMSIHQALHADNARALWIWFVSRADNVFYFIQYFTVVIVVALYALGVPLQAVSPSGASQGTGSAQETRGNAPTTNGALPRP